MAVNWDAEIAEMEKNVVWGKIASSEREELIAGGVIPSEQDVHTAVMLLLEEDYGDFVADYPDEDHELELDWDEAIAYNERFDEAKKNLNSVKSVMFFLERVLPKCQNY